MRKMRFFEFLRLPLLLLLLLLLLLPVGYKPQTLYGYAELLWRRKTGGARNAHKTFFNYARDSQADGIREIKSGLAHRNILSGSAKLAAGTGGEARFAGLSIGT